MGFTSMAVSSGLALVVVCGCARDDTVHALDASSGSDPAADSHLCLSAAAKQALLEAMFALDADVQVAVERIEAEVLALGEHPWAGKYYSGDGLGSNHRLWIAPHGFAYARSGCGGTYGQAHGGLTATKDLLTLTFTPNRESISAGALYSTLVPIPWGHWRYLVAPERIDGFMEDVGLGVEPRKTSRGTYFLREPRPQEPTTGKPSVPAGHTR